MSHYFSEKQTSPFVKKTIEFTVDSVSLSLTTAPGVFSRKRLDKGTETLIKYAKIPSEGKLLDLGCGYGVVGLYFAKKNPKLQVIATDINERAVALAKENAKRNKLENVEVIQSDGIDQIETQFTTVLLNPPQTAGRKECKKLITQAKQVLILDGSLQIVARHKKGGKLLSEFMDELFGNVETLAKKGGYRVYKSEKKKE